MHRITLSTMFAVLMVFGGVAQAQDSLCDNLGDYPEAGLCDAYCVAMDCDLIGDGDPLSSPQASEAACRNVAATFLSFLDGVPRREVDPVVAMDTLDDEYCRVGCRPPDCDP